MDKYILFSENNNNIRVNRVPFNRVKIDGDVKKETDEYYIAKLNSGKTTTFAFKPKGLRLLLQDMSNNNQLKELKNTMVIESEFINPSIGFGRVSSEDINLQQIINNISKNSNEDVFCSAIICNRFGHLAPIVFGRKNGKTFAIFQQIELLQDLNNQNNLQSKLLFFDKQFAIPSIQSTPQDCHNASIEFIKTFCKDNYKHSRNILQKYDNLLQDNNKTFLSPLKDIPLKDVPFELQKYYQQKGNYLNNNIIQSKKKLKKVGKYLFNNENEILQNNRLHLRGFQIAKKLDELRKQEDEKNNNVLTINKVKKEHQIDRKQRIKMNKIAIESKDKDTNSQNSNRKKYNQFLQSKNLLKQNNKLFDNKSEAKPRFEKPYIAYLKEQRDFHNNYCDCDKEQEIYTDGQKKIISLLENDLKNKLTKLREQRANKWYLFSPFECETLNSKIKFLQNKLTEYERNIKNKPIRNTAYKIGFLRDAVNNVKNITASCCGASL